MKNIIKIPALTFFVILILQSFTYKKKYESILIGNQTWMKKNLAETKFKNGDEIPEAKTFLDWKMAGEKESPAWCYYEFNSNNGIKYGILYNWYAVNDSRGLAPKGWHIPSKEEFEELSNFLGGNEISGKKIKSTYDWKNIARSKDAEMLLGKSKDPNGTNKSGFNALPGGYNMNGTFKELNLRSIWWSSTSSNDLQAYYFDLVSGDNIKIYNGGTGLFGAQSQFTKKNGYYVRCVKDE